MTSPFLEAHQFKGVFADPVKVRMSYEPGLSADVAAALRAPPPHDGRVSMYFSDGTAFDVQEDHSGQYLVLAPDEGRVRERCHVGEWIVKMPSGKFKVLTNEDYLALGGTPE